MLFVGYGAPSSPSPAELPSASATVRSIRSIRSSSLSSDAIEADLRSLYSQALRLQNTKQHTAALALYHRILTHKCYHSHRTQHTNRSNRRHSRRTEQGREDEEEGDGVGGGADRGLEQLWRLTWRNVGDLFHIDEQHHIALHCYHTALASHYTTITAVSSSAVTLRPLLLSLARSAVHTGQLSLARRTLETALVRVAHEADGSEWDVIDALVDVLYCIGDHHALAALLETALQLDSGYVKGLLLYSQLYAASLASLSLSAAVYAHCQHRLQHVPRSHAHTVTKQLLQLATTQRSLATVLYEPATHAQPAAIYRTITFSSTTPLTAFATSLLALYNELLQAQRQTRKLTQTADALTVHQLLRLMKDNTQRLNESNDNEQIRVEVDDGGSSVVRRSSSASAASASSNQSDNGTAVVQSLASTTHTSLAACSLATPIVLTVSHAHTAPLSEEKAEEKGEEDKDVIVVRVTNNSKAEPTIRPESKLAAVQYAQVTVGKAATIDPHTLSFDHPTLVPLATVLPSSRSADASSTSPSSLYPTADAGSSLSSFLSDHASSASSNSGCVDVMHRYLRWLREASLVGADCTVLSRLIDVAWRHGLLSDTDVDELLFCGEVVLDAQSGASTAPSSHAASTLSSLVAQLTLCALSPASVLSVTQRVRLSHLRAHCLLLDNDVPSAMHQLQRTIELLSTHPAASPIRLPHSPHTESISATSLQETVERLQSLQLLHELHRLNGLRIVAGNAAVLDTFMAAYRAEPARFEQRLLAFSDDDRDNLMEELKYASIAENSGVAVRGWQVMCIEGRRLAAQLLAGGKQRESAAGWVVNLCERIIRLFTDFSATNTRPERTDVLDMLRSLSVSLSLLFQPTGEEEEELDVPLITAMNQLAMYYHTGSISLSPIAASSSDFLLHMSLLSASHRLLACVNGCRTAAGRALLSSHLESLFHNRHLRLNEHHSVATLLPLLPPLPACFMPTTPPSPSPSTAPSMAEPAALVLSEASRLLSDLCDLFSPSYPSHLSDKSHCTVLKDQMLSSPLWRARLLHLLGSHLLSQHETTGSVTVLKEMRESILACLEQLAAYMSSPTIPSSSFITAYLTHPPSLSLASSFALIPSTAVVWGDELTTSFYRFHGHYILPAYIQRVNEADDWYSNASYRREWESEQSLLSSLTTLCLLSQPTSPYLWYSLGLLHWEPAQRELSSAYAELCIDPLHLARQQSERAGKRREEEERVRASGWVEKVNHCTRCFLYCLHLLGIEFGSTATLQRIFEAGDDSQLDNAFDDGNDSEAVRPDSMDRRLVLIVWEKLAFLAYRLAQMMQYLPFLRAEEAAASAIRVIPPHFTRRRTPSPVPATAAVQDSAEGDVVAADELRVSYACFRVAARLAPRHWVVEYMMGKCSSKTSRLPHAYIRHFQTAAELCYEQWKQQRESAQSVETAEVGKEKEDVEMAADTVTAEEVDEADGAVIQDGDNTEDEDDEEEDEHRMNVYPLYRLHSWRLKLAEHVKQLITDSAESEADVISVEVSGGKLPSWTAAEREEVLTVLEASSFNPPPVPSRSSSPSVSTAPPDISDNLPPSPPRISASGLSSTDAALVTRCDAIVSNVAMAMHECIRRDSRCYSALTKLAHIWLDRQPNSKLRWLADRLQPFAHYPRSKPLNKFDKFDSRTVDTELHAFSAHPRQLDWWQHTPWRGCAGYFKCLERYLQLLVRLRSITGFLSLYTLVNLARRLPDLPAIKRLHVYGRYLLLLLEQLAHNESDGDAAGGGGTSEYELLCQRACEVCVQLHDQNIHMQRLLVLAYVVQHQRVGQAMSIDAVDHGDVRRWLMEQRWARRINVSDLIGGSVGQDKSLQSGAGAAGTKRRREDDSSRPSAERVEADEGVERGSKRLEMDVSIPLAGAAHSGQSASDNSVSTGKDISSAGTTVADSQQPHSGNSPAEPSTTITAPIAASSITDAEFGSARDGVTDSMSGMQPADDVQAHYRLNEPQQAILEQPTLALSASIPLSQLSSLATPASPLESSGGPSASLDDDVVILVESDKLGEREEQRGNRAVQQLGGSNAAVGLYAEHLPPLEARVPADSTRT